MTDLNHFEDDLRAMLADVEARVSPDHGLEDRLVAGASAAPSRPVPHRVGTVRTLGRRAPRWLPPLLAAAAVITVVAGGAAIVNNISADRAHPATSVPAPSPHATVTNHAAPTPSTNPTTPHGSTVPAGFVGVKAWFRDAQNGYVIGNVPCRAKPGYCATLIRTDDGGSTWATVALPKGITPVDDKGNLNGGSCADNGNIYGPCVDQVAFPDPMHGYVWSFHSFFSTNDGGATWTVGKDPNTQNGYARATQLAFTGSQAFRIGPVADCSSGCTYQVQWATIGSSTWHTVTPTRPNPFQAATLISAGGSVYLTGAQLTTSGSNPSGSLFRWTGSAWQTITTTLCSAFATMSAAPDGTVSVLCPGTSQTVQLLDGNTLGQARLAPPGTEFLAAVSAQVLLVFVPSQSGTATVFTQYQSTDGGSSWHTFGRVEPWTPVTATFGYGISADGTTLDVTTDGGATFHSHRLA